MKARLSRRGVSMVRFNVSRKDTNSYTCVDRGFSKFMTLAAILLSWCVNQSIWWGILHAIFGGFYVVYWFIVYSGLPEWINKAMVI